MRAMTGSDVAWYPDEPAVDLLPQASVTVWPANGHFPHLAHPRRFAECLAATARWNDLAWQP
jgi:pimeloyl-ACP methyl ester carboxylesterase